MLHGTLLQFNRHRSGKLVDNVGHNIQRKCVHSLIDETARVSGVLCQHLSYVFKFLSELLYGALQQEPIFKKCSCSKRKRLLIVSNVPFAHYKELLFDRFQLFQIFNLYKYRPCARHQLENKKNLTFLGNFSGSILYMFKFDTRYAYSSKFEGGKINYGNQMLKRTLLELLDNVISRDIKLASIPKNDLRSMFLQLY